MIKKHLGKITALAAGLLMLIFAILYQKTESVSGAKEWVKIISNAALVPAVLLTGFGILAMISDEGFFDGIKYATSCMFAHIKRNKKKYATYYDYIHREKKSKGGKSLLIPGLFYMAVAVALTGVYYIL